MCVTPLPLAAALIDWDTCGLTVEQSHVMSPEAAPASTPSRPR
jgi:hypothetical protein